MRKYFKKYRIRTVGAVLIIILSSIISVVGAFILSGMVNAATSGDAAALKWYLLGALAYFLVYILVGRLDNYLQNTLAQDVNISLRKDIFSAIIKGNRSEFYQKTVGEYMSVITNDVDMIANAYVGAILTITGAVVTILVAVISIICIEARLLLFAMFNGVLYLVFTSKLSKNLSVYKERWKETLEEYTEQMKDLLSGYEVIRDFDLQDKSVEMFEKSSTYTGEQKKQLSISVDNLSNINYIIGQAMVIAIVFAGACLVTANQITIGELIALVQLLATIIAPLQEMAGCINELMSIKNIKNNLIGKILRWKKLDEEKMAEGKMTVEQLDIVDSNIRMEDVSFSYDGVHNVLEDVNIKLEQGKKYAIIGESGTGKSSLIGLLMNYYENYQGKISLNGTDYRKISEESLSKLFAVVHQNVILFDGTVKDNITLFQNKSAEEVNEVIESACLDGFAGKKSLECSLLENGSNLSGGEKQRISIARALLMKRKILVLDEATSALDEETATKVMTNILRIKGQTCIAILHYLPTAVKGMFDYIFRVENGRLVMVDS